MIRMKLAEIAAVVEGDLTEPAKGREVATRAATDTRELRAGDLFFAIEGEHFDGEHRDGHDFLSEAARKGAAGAVVMRPTEDPLPQIVVKDTLAGLARLAGHNRDVTDPVVIAVTGSTGKTSTKDILGKVASRRFRTVTAERSMNNEIGLPMTLLRADLATECIVCELAAQREGEIADLCRFARPQIGVVTNVGEAHMGYFRTQRAIASAKGELPEALDDAGTAILNADDPIVAAMARRTDAHVLTYGMSPDAWMRADGLELDRLGRVRFFMINEGQKLSVELSLSGRHQVLNALAAAAAGKAIGLSLEECRTALESSRPSAGRMEVIESGIVIVNDAYNANPASVAAGLQTCREMKGSEGRVVAVLGYMAELGEFAEDAHEDVGRMVAGNADALVVVGSKASGIAKGARAAGLQSVTEVNSKGEVIEALTELGLRRGDVVILKASRVEALDELVEPLKEIVAP